MIYTRCSGPARPGCPKPAGLGVSVVQEWRNRLRWVMLVRDDLPGRSVHLLVRQLHTPSLRARAMLVRGNFQSQHSGTQISIRCPGCRQLGTFMLVPQAVDIAIQGGVVLGMRKCPNNACNVNIFFVHQGSQLLASYPPETLDFDASGVPAAVSESLEEALTCHAHQCFVAAAIMVRKTLEALCRDRGATGSSLKERIGALGSKVVLPKELLDALDDLRLLGNDAAHIESQEYDQVGKQEVEVAISVTKEVLKAVYQYASLLSQLRALKKQP